MKYAAKILKNQQQSGLASIVIVFVLVVLLSLIGISFTKIMDRSLQSSTASQLATAANYAAQSATNNTIAYLKATPNAPATTDCKALTKAGGPLENLGQLSGDSTTQYTCILTDPNPTDLVYQSLDSYQSQVIALTTTATATNPVSSIMFSWQSTNRDLPIGYPNNNSDEITWGTGKYPPVLRVTLYPLDLGGGLSNVEAGAKTFFFTPRGSGTRSISYTDPEGLTPVNCHSGQGASIGTFIGTADYDCNVVVNIPAPAGYYMVKITPYYGQAQVKIKANNNNGQASKFLFVQAVIDTTAKSGSAVKRLQTRVDLNDNTNINDLPEFALRTAETICKRLVVAGGAVYTDPTSALKNSGSCLNLNPAGRANDFTLAAAPRSQTIAANTSFDFTITVAPAPSFNGNVALASSSADKPNSVTVDFIPTPVVLNNAPATSRMRVTVGAGTPAGDYHIKVTGTSGATSHSDDVTITVPAPSPDYTIGANSPITIQQGQNKTTNVTVTPQNGCNAAVKLDNQPPAGLTTSFKANTNPVANCNGLSPLKISVGKNTPLATYNLDITGTAPGIPGPHGTRIRVIVTAAPVPNRTLTVHVVGSGQVNSFGKLWSCISSTCPPYTYKDGDSDTLGTTTFGTTFQGWSGDCSGTGTCDLVFNSNKDVTATFTGSSGCGLSCPPPPPPPPPPISEHTEVWCICDQGPQGPGGSCIYYQYVANLNGTPLTNCYIGSVCIDDRTGAIARLSAC